MQYFILSIIKIFDNIILTAKSIATYQEKRIISSFLVVLSQFIFYLIISEVVEANTFFVIVIVSVSSGVGNYIAFIINDKFKKDAKWSMVITSKDKEEILRFCNYLTKYNIKHIANHGLTRQGEETVHVLVFSKTKEESKLIDKFLEDTNSKYLKEMI